MSEPRLKDYEGLCRAAVEALAETVGRVKLPDPAAAWHGGGAHAAYGPVISLAMAAFDPASPVRGRESVCRRAEEALGVLGGFQHDDGLIDLHVSNFHSPPDAAFMVEELAPLYAVLRDCCEPSRPRDRLLEGLGRILVRACDGMARGGVHTPNHRWKMASALALADRLWPHESWRREAQAYLDEGIDIDEDGEFTERSAGCYNQVCDRALILLGRALGRGDLLECADRNLRHMLYLLHADGTLVTNYSRRQDRDTSVGVERYLLLYWYRALTAGDGLFWSAAELGLQRLLREAPGRLGGLAMWLRFFREAGEMAPPAPRALPDEYEKRFEEVGVLRRRSGAQSLTIMAGSADLLAVRFGAGPEIGGRVCAAFAPRGQLIAEEIEGEGGRYSLRSQHACEYYGPGPDTLPATDRRARPAFSRRVFVATELAMTLQVEAFDEGLRLRLRSQGCGRVPVELALRIRQAEKIEAGGRLARDAETGKHFFGRGELIVRGPTHALRIGPGADEHNVTQIGTGEPYPGRDAYCIRLVTPVDATLTIRAAPR